MTRGCSQQYTTGGYVFHSTQPDRISSIRRHGLRAQPKDCEHASADILAVLEELGCRDAFPFDRRSVVYAYVDAEYALGLISEYEGEDGWLASDAVLVVIDLAKVSAPMYVANMSIITDLIDYRYAGSENMMHAETPEQAVELYQQSIEPVSSWSDIEAYSRAPHEELELVIENEVPASAIVDILG